MQQTSIFEPDDVDYESEFHIDQETYEILKAINTKTILLLDKCSMIKWLYIPN